MKKNILASTALLSVALVSNTAFAEENTTTTPSVTDKSETIQPVADAPKQDSKPELEQPKAEEAAKPAAATEQPKEKPASTVQKNGWKKEENIWRYYTNHVAEKDWKKINGKWYFFDKDGVMLENTTYDGYVFNKDGAMVEKAWTLVNDKWYYAQESGKYIQNKWEKINGKWYFFNKDGVMLENTTYDGYVFNKDGAMVEKAWALVNNKWYYAQESGKYIQNKWEKINGKWYFFNKDGIMQANKWQGSYYLTDSGAMAENACVRTDGKWYYVNSSGQYIRDKWEKINGKWYFFDKGGVMQANKWQGRYYLKDSGAMAESEWVFDQNYNSWFYLKANGAYAENEWSGAYYLKRGGYMAKNEWIWDSSYNAWYYLKDNGAYVSGVFDIKGTKHLFQENGKWVSEATNAFVKGQYNKVVFIDPGHGGKDGGAVYYGVAEKTLNLQIYNKLKPELEKLGYTVLTSRSSDVDVDYVTERSRMANRTNADVFISIHFNASGKGAGSAVQGIQTYSYMAEAGYPSKINQDFHNRLDRISESNRLATAIHKAVLAETNARDAGMHRASLAVLRETAKPAVLLELGYMDNPTENSLIRTDSYQNKLVAGIVKGIQNFYSE